MLPVLLGCGGGSAATTSTQGGAGTGGAAGTGGTGGGAPAEVSCDGSKLLVTPEDPGARGPWAVGARTATLAGLTTEIWYPAAPGSDAGKTRARYDIRLQLPDADQGKIPDQDNPWQDCDCVRDLPLDTAHGPYPMVLFVHGTAGFRTQSLTFMTHWASRGFVVVAADHPGMQLKDILSGSINMSQGAQAAQVLTALQKPAGDAAFLDAHLAPGKLALSGHSAGGGAIATFGDQAEVLIPMAAGGVEVGAALVSTLVLGAMNDGIAQYSGQTSGFASSPKKKRLVGLANAGHLAFSDLCFLGRDQGGILKIAEDHGVMVNPLIAALATDGCKPGQLAAEKGWAIVEYATSAVLEETLACGAGSAAKLAAIKSAFADVGEAQEDL
jgi:hypothetical protein